MRVGILGGTFSPVHHGHVICAQEARLQLELDVVRLMPVGTPPHRHLQAGEDPGDQHRLSMLRLALIGQPGLELATTELERAGTSYTVDTLTELVDQEPQAQFTLIIGADQAMSFGNWCDPERIGQLAEIAVAARVDHNRDEAIAEVIRATGGKEPVLFEMPRVDISSTFIRDRIYGGTTVAHLVPAGIPELIEEAGLYR
ncbi:MAG: nicotinate (nicotinamide) nucleotide adenylyltransferase [Thermoleophilaceae bacterium]|nr:nicotinate (nicotinamide) nucleotide adenylyltransferase [Thermoleophilaceae bacterium]